MACRMTDTKRKGTPDPIRLEIDLLPAGRAAQELRSLRGSVRLDLDVQELRRDRR